MHRKCVKMNKLKCRKQKMNGMFECKKTGKIITLKECIDCKNKEYKASTEYRRPRQKNLSIKKKSSKLSKLEKTRYSVFTEDLNTCFYSNKDCFGSISKHELFSGRNRQRSMKYGYILPLCEYHHSTLQNNPIFNQYWHDRCRKYWLENYSTLEEFIEVFGKSYL